MMLIKLMALLRLIKILTNSDDKVVLVSKCLASTTIKIADYNITFLIYIKEVKNDAFPYSLPFFTGHSSYREHTPYFDGHHYGHGSHFYSRNEAF